MLNQVVANENSRTQFRLEQSKACLYLIGDSIPDHPPACLWEGRMEFGIDIADIVVKSS